MKIGIDLDEVIADFLPALIEYHNTTYGTHLNREQFQSYKFWENWGGTREEAIQKVYDFHQTPYFKNIKPVMGVQETIDILKQNHELFVITSRQDKVAEATKEWIAQHFPNTFSGVYFANHYSQTGEPITKNKICDSLGIDIMIEDSPEYALECFQPNRKIFLINCPWNKDTDLPEEVFRVNSWEEILNNI